MSTGRRFYRLLSSYVETEWERIRGVIDESGIYRPAAEQEFNEAMNFGTTPPPQYAPPQPSAPPPVAPPSQPATAQTLDRFYLVLGVPIGSDFAVVRYAYQKLSRRADPTKFDDGSEARTQAMQIHARVEEAYDALRKALDPSAARFAKLDLGDKSE